MGHQRCGPGEFDLVPLGAWIEGLAATLTLPPPDQIPSCVGKGDRLWGSKGGGTAAEVCSSSACRF